MEPEINGLIKIILLIITGQISKVGLDKNKLNASQNVFEMHKTSYIVLFQKFYH